VTTLLLTNLLATSMWNFVIYFLGIITVNPPEVRPVFILPTRDLKLYTLLT